MKIVKYIDMLWATLDSLMIFMILVLITAIMFVSDINGVVDGESVKHERREESRADSVVGHESRRYNVAPVVYERARAHQIARKMVGYSVERLPARHALDMREVDSSYQIRFSLPRDVNESNLDLEINQNILTFLMESDHKTYMRRIRIPCDYASNSSLSHFVSNNVLFVEIEKLPEK